ncbi:MAG: hypothetical protein M3R12_05345, partial [Actinomycetota bacterium]|nr:hypothetical protein [Actinomycetota bacterium]
LSKAGLVSHHKPEDEPIHWFATREGRTQGEKLHRAIASQLLVEPAPAVEADTPPTEEAVGSGEHQRVRSRRRVSIDQTEKTGFSWD